MKVLSLIVASLVSWAGIASAQNNTMTTTVTGNQGPWAWVNGGLNTAYQYAGDGTMGAAPTVISASDGFRFSVGDSLTISYLSGLVSVGGVNPSVDANGNTTTPVNDSTFYGGYPSYYMSPYPIYISELVGTFADSSGQIVGTPFAIGDLGTFSVPTGATQLQLGVNDSWYADNSGSWNIQVTGPAVPEPSTWAMVALGVGVVLGGLRLRRRSS